MGNFIFQDIIFSLIFERIQPDEIRSFLFSSSTYCSVYAWCRVNFLLSETQSNFFHVAFLCQQTLHLPRFPTGIFFLLWIFVSFAFNFVQVLVEHLCWHIFILIRCATSSRKERGRKTQRMKDGEKKMPTRNFSLFDFECVCLTLSTIPIPY